MLSQSLYYGIKVVEGLNLLARTSKVPCKQIFAAHVVGVVLSAHHECDEQVEYLLVQW
jgi:hypothetical protein